MMPKLLDLIREASARILDPSREERILWLATEVEKDLRRQRDDFDFETTAATLGIAPRDIPLVAQKTYESALTLAWRDRKITSKERAALRWIANAVQLHTDQLQQIEERAGCTVFEEYLASAISDGAVDEKEAAILNTIAQSMGTTTTQLMRTYFMNEGEAFLRGVFTSITLDGRISENEWKNLLTTTSALGLGENELLRIIVPQAERFVEHVLVDAKADERITADEQDTLAWMLERLKLPPGFRQYVKDEIRELSRFSDIADGTLPSIEPTGVLLRAGEIAHFHSYARYEQTRHLKSGPRIDSFDGSVTITDVRLLFSSETKSFDLNHRKCVEIVAQEVGMQIRTGSRGAGDYDFGSNNKLAIAIYRAAVGKANQTVLEKNRGKPTRHIPRDVRQRVWQKYGGRCSNCSSNQYLEFDHIIPVAKGGSNDEANVQLLCRKCNLKKSDRI